MTWIDALPANRRRGSYPRCLLLMQGGREPVAERLTKLVAIAGVSVSADDRWMPTGIPALVAPGRWDLAPALANNCMPSLPWATGSGSTSRHRSSMTGTSSAPS